VKTLAFELSSARGSLTWRDGDFEWAAQWANDRKNSGEFFQNVAEARKLFGAPEQIIVGLGPGSYAGTRIAISTAIGLQLATKANLVGLSSLCAIESDAVEYAIVGDARRQSFFLAQVRDNTLAVPPGLYTEADLRIALENLRMPMPIFSVETLPQFEGVNVRYPSARILAQLAGEANRAFVLPPLEPMYLREPHITTPKQNV
jgi:tRNA threonylcarbamoyladenosine biosynthesis protein TsaB